jgi:hypothetical protein
MSRLTTDLEEAQIWLKKMVCLEAPVMSKQTMVSVVARLWFKTKASLVALSTFNLIMALEAVPQW